MTGFEPGPLVLEATAMSTAPQPLPISFKPSQSALFQRRIFNFTLKFVRDIDSVYSMKKLASQSFPTKK